MVILKQFGEEFPYPDLGIPLVLIGPIAKDNELYRISIYQACGDIYKQLNALVNIRNLALRNSVTGYTLCNTSAGVTSSMLVSATNRMIDVKGELDPQRSLVHINIPDNASGVHVEIGNYIQYVRSCTGNTDMTMGMGRSSAPTARGTQVLLQQAQSRFNMFVYQGGEDMARLMSAMFKVDRKFVNTERAMRVVGERGRATMVTVGPDMFNHGYDPKFDTRPSAANPELQAQTETSLFAAIKDVPGVNVPKLAVHLLELHNVRNPHQYLLQPLRGPERENGQLAEEGTMPPVRTDDNHYYHLQVHEPMLKDGRVRQASQQFGRRAETEYARHMNDHKAFQAKMGLTAAVGPSPTPAPGAAAPIQFGQGGPPQGQPPPAPASSQESPPLPAGVPSA
jgi:hypothetical protein